MTNNTMKFKASRWCSLFGTLALICAASVVGMAQTTTPSGTTISNTATATYSDAVTDGTDFTTTSNTVTVLVTDVAGLAITPDAGTRANVVVSQTGVDFLFTITNTGNFTNQVVFKQAGASIILTGLASITAAVIDLDKDGAIDVGDDTDILANGADVTSANVAQNGTLFIIVRTTISAVAPGGSTINVQLGDAAVASPWDNEVLVASTNDVVTALHGTDVQVEARGNVSAIVNNAGGVLLGPSGFPGAFGSGSNTNDDYTNRSVNTGIFVKPGLNTNATGTTTFTNSVQNTGNANDTFTFSSPAITSGFTVEVSVNGGTSYANISSSPTLAVDYNTTGTILVRITAPSGIEVLKGYAHTITATSATDAATNDTIDRLYTGYLSLDKSQTVTNATGKGDGTLTDAVAGATIAYVVAYDNESLEDGGTNSSPLVARNIVLIDAIPTNTVFKLGSGILTNLGGGISAAVIEYSNDNKTSWTYTPVSGTSAPAGFDGTVTHVRFVLTGAMAPAGAAGSNGFTVRIK